MPKLYFEIDTDKINELQLSSMLKIIERAKHVSWTNIQFRVNGEMEYKEADWLKHFTLVEDRARLKVPQGE